MVKINPLGVIGYSYDELSKEAKERVINDTIKFWIETREYDKENKGNFEKAVDKAEEMRTSWFTGEYIYEYCLNELENEVRINRYLFNEKGEMFPLINHVSGKITYNLIAGTVIDIQLVEI